MSDGIDYPVVVVGTGAWGTMALWALARRGIRALGLDQFGVGNGMGASIGGTRMFRLSTLEHPALGMLARRSLNLFQHLQVESERALITQSGGLIIGRRDSSIVVDTLASAKASGIAVHVLDNEELRRRFPQHRAIDGSTVGVWEPSAGVVLAETTVQCAAAAAVAGGSTIQTCCVTGIEERRDRVVVTTSLGEVTAGRVIVAVGAWLQSFLEGTTGEVIPQLSNVIRMSISWIAPEQSHAHLYTLERFPVFMRALGPSTVLWGNGATHGWAPKFGIESGGTAAPRLDPTSTDRSVSSADWRPLVGIASEYLGGLAGYPTRTSVGMLASTLDGQFVIGPVQEASRVIVAGGDNAHGFKHAPAVGEILSGLALGKPLPPQLAFMSATRDPRGQYSTGISASKPGRVCT